MVEAPFGVPAPRRVAELLVTLVGVLVVTVGGSGVVKVTKDPKIDKKYAKKFPMAKKAIRIDLTGRRNVTIKRTWILANCKNDRQYQIEIYLTGTQGTKVFGKTIEKFLKDFKPVKGG